MDFDPSKRWPMIENPEKLNLKSMDHDFIDLLNEFATSVEKKMIVNQGATNRGHSSGSQHYKRPCKAADVYFPGLDIDEIFYFAAMYKNKNGKEFGAVGAYPYWSRPGLHIDGREIPVYWYRDVNNQYHYSTDIGEIEKALIKIVEKMDHEIDFCDNDF